MLFGSKEYKLVTVYLDSKDYSDLSRADMSADLEIIKRKLLDLSSSGVVKFYYSPMILSEILPIEEKAEKYAIDRAIFLEALCQKNVLLDYGSLAEYEFSRLAEKRSEISMPDCQSGDWFPITDIYELGGGDDEWTRFSVESYMNDSPDFKKNFPELWEVGESFVSGNEDLKSAYDRARMLFVKPSVIARLAIFGKEFGGLLNNIIRSAGEAGEASAKLLLDDHLNSMGSPDVSRSSWNKMVNELVLNTAVDGAKGIGGEVSGINIDDVLKYCPGNSTVTRLLFSAIWDSYKGGKADYPSDNQIQDSLHSIYAPYVDIFCADKYTASHLKELVKNNGTHVISKITQLPSLIEGMLAKSSPA